VLKNQIQFAHIQHFSVGLLFLFAFRLCLVLFLFLFCLVLFLFVVLWPQQVLNFFFRKIYNKKRYPKI